MAAQPTGNNLVILYMAQGSFTEAERIIKRTTSYLEEGFGPTNAPTLCAFHNQAVLFRNQGKVMEARNFPEKTIDGWEDSGEGVAKPEADSNYCLAAIHEDSEDKRSEAEHLCREAAELYSHALGKDHPQMVDAFKRADAAHRSSTTPSQPSTVGHLPIREKT